MRRKARHKKCILEEDLLSTMTSLRLESLVRLWRGLIVFEGQSGSQLARDGYTMGVRAGFVHTGAIGLEQASDMTARCSSLLVFE